MPLTKKVALYFDEVDLSIANFIYKINKKTTIETSSSCSGLNKDDHFNQKPYIHFDISNKLDFNMLKDIANQLHLKSEIWDYNLIKEIRIKFPNKDEKSKIKLWKQFQSLFWKEIKKIKKKNIKKIEFSDELEDKLNFKYFDDFIKSKMDEITDIYLTKILKLSFTTPNESFVKKFKNDLINLIIKKTEEAKLEWQSQQSDLYKRLLILYNERKKKKLNLR